MWWAHFLSSSKYIRATLYIPLQYLKTSLKQNLINVIITTPTHFENYVLLLNVRLYGGNSSDVNNKKIFMPVLSDYEC